MDTPTAPITTPALIAAFTAQAEGVRRTVDRILAALNDGACPECGWPTQDRVTALACVHCDWWWPL